MDRRKSERTNLKQEKSQLSYDSIFFIKILPLIILQIFC